MAPRQRERATTTNRRLVASLAWLATSVLVTAACSGTARVEAPTSGTDPTTTVATTDGTATGAAAATDELCRGTATTTMRDLAYHQVDGIDPNLLSLDLYVPVLPEGCGPTPLVVYVHGGGFATGDKANRIGDKVALFTGEGWAFASVNYRLSPDRPDPDGASGEGPAEVVRYPIHEQDVAAAIAWLVEHASDHDLDAARLVLVGHSSGAYLVSLLSTDTSFLEQAGVDPARVRCTVSLDTEYDAAAQVAQGGAQEALYRNALGEDPAVWAAASPLTHAGDPGHHPSFLIITQGPPRRTGGAQAFAAALVAAGTEAEAVDVSPMDHEGVNAAIGAPGDEVITPRLVRFARDCIGGT